jgi:hypothetical protein
MVQFAMVAKAKSIRSVRVSQSLFLLMNQFPECNKAVEETYIMAQQKPYHLNCFLCERCHQPFPGRQSKLIFYFERLGGEFYVHRDKAYDMDCYWGVRLADEMSLSDK